MKGNEKMVITIKKESQPIMFLKLSLIVLCFGGFFTDVLGFPRIIKYINDFLIVILLIYTIRKLFHRRAVYLTENIKKVLLSLLIIISVYIASSMVEDISFSLMLWGIRNTLKGMLYFIICVVLMTKEDVDSIASKINPFFLINVIVCLYEFYVIGVSADYVGGTFGTTQGCNAFLNVLIVIVTMWNALRYTNKKQGLIRTVIYIALCALIAGMAELKIFVVEVLLVLILVGVFSKGFIKKLLICIMGILIASVCIDLIEKLIPGWDDFFTLESMLDMVTSESGYTNKGDLNRFTSISMLNRKIFSGDVNWFGIGLGNSEYSDTFSFLNSRFYQTHKSLHYGWFTIAKVYIELGYFGIISMMYLWLNCAGTAIKGGLKHDQERGVYCKIALVMALISPLLFIYNATLHMDAACLVYLCMALGYIVTKDDIKMKKKGGS